jgi:hypothetical protein
MLDAGEDIEKRGKYSLELLNLMLKRGYDTQKARNLQKFIYRILRVWDEKIDPQVKEVWKMQLIPISEAVREIQIRDAKEEGKEEGAEEAMVKVARSMRAEGLSNELIKKCTGLNEKDIITLN